MNDQSHATHRHAHTSRRDFIKGVGAATLALTVAACVPLPAPVAGPAVALAHARNYDRALIRKALRDMLDGIGGLRDVVSRGDRVAIKTNLTGGLYFKPPTGYAPTESFLTHPEVVRALGELLRDAGARDLFIVEAVYDKESYPLFGYEEVARDLGATLLDLNRPDPYTDFVAAGVGDGAAVYGDFTFNHILQEVDAFVSVSKLKCHYSAGVTHTMKNLVGLVPADRYTLSAEDWWRSAFHGTDAQVGARLPRVIVDLNRARPIHLAVIDGVMTGEAGEVPRENNTFAAVQPGILAAGKNAVATDAVATALMGFDPEAEYPDVPFVRGENHLNLARLAGLGTNRLNEIRVAGPSISDLRFPFRPA